MAHDANPSLPTLAELLEAVASDLEYDGNVFIDRAIGGMPTAQVEQAGRDVRAAYRCYGAADELRRGIENIT